jgi:5'(3')-deoxyribonucleotidase
MRICTSPDRTRNRLNIAIDFDATIADTNSVKAAWIKKNLGLEVPSSRCGRTSCEPIIGIANYEAMAELVYGDKAIAVTPPVQGAIEAIHSLARRASLFVVTNRRDSNIQYAESWLEKRGVSTQIEAIVSAARTTKTQICADSGLDILLDDDIRHRSTNSKLRFVLFDPHGDGSSIWNVDRVRTWQEFVDFVEAFPVRSSLTR